MISYPRSPFKIIKWATSSPRKKPRFRIKAWVSGGSQTTLSHAFNLAIMKTDPADHENQKKNKSLGVHFCKKSCLESKPYYDPSTNENPNKRCNNNTKYFIFRLAIVSSLAISLSWYKKVRFQPNLEAVFQGNTLQSARRVNQLQNPISCQI